MDRMARFPRFLISTFTFRFCLGVTRLAAMVGFDRAGFFVTH